MTKFLNKGLKEEDKVEGPLKILRNIEGKTKEELKAIKNQKKVQTKVIIKDKIKSPVLKSIYNHEVKNRRIDNNKVKKTLTTLENMEGSKIDYSKLVCRSDDNEYFDFTWFEPLSSFYLKLIDGNIGINIAKLKLKEFKNEVDSLKRKKSKKQSYKTNKKDVLKNAEALYNRLNIIVNAFENRIFESKYRPEIDIDNDLRDDQKWNLHAAFRYESHGLTNKELQMFRKSFSYKNPVELRQAFIEATGKKYNDL